MERWVVSGSRRIEYEVGIDMPITGNRAGLSGAR